jgi:hypothetical protein
MAWCGNCVKISIERNMEAIVLPLYALPLRDNH